MAIAKRNYVDTTNVTTREMRNIIPFKTRYEVEQEREERKTETVKRIVFGIFGTVLCTLLGLCAIYLGREMGDAEIGGVSVILFLVAFMCFTYIFYKPEMEE